MHFKSLVAIFLATFAVAASSDLEEANAMERRDAQNLATIRATMEMATKDLNEVETGIQALSAETANAQLPIINEKLTRLSVDMISQAKKLNASGAVGITEGLGLVTNEASRNQLIGVVLKLALGLNGTVVGLLAKKDIVKASGKAEVLRPGIKAQRQPLVDIVSTVPGQIPGIAITVVNQLLARAAQQIAAKASGASAGPEGAQTDGATPPPPAPPINVPKLDINMLRSPQVLNVVGNVLDGLLDQTVEILKGTQEGINVAGLNLPKVGGGGLGGLAPPAAGSLGASSAPTAVPAPPAYSAPSIPVSNPSPKGASPPQGASPKGSASAGSAGSAGGAAKGGKGGKGKGTYVNDILDIDAE